MTPKDERYKLIDIAELSMIVGCIHDIRERLEAGSYAATVKYPATLPLIDHVVNTEERLCKLLGVDVNGNKLGTD